MNDVDDEAIKRDPYGYVIKCVPRFKHKARWYKGRTDDDDDIENDPDAQYANAHNTKKCACYTKGNDGWALMRKAWAREKDTSSIEIPHRNPDAFGMYIYNDFQGPGSLRPPPPQSYIS